MSPTLTSAQHARLSIVRAGAASSDLATRLSALSWAKENFTPLEKAHLYNNMRPFWADYSAQERALYSAIAQDADIAIQGGQVGCSFCVLQGVGCGGNPNCRCQQAPHYQKQGVGFSLSDFQQGTKAAGDIAKEAAALGVSIDTYSKCTQKENWGAPYCPWNKGKDATNTTNPPGAATTTPSTSTPSAPSQNNNDDDESNPWLIPVGVGAAAVLLLIMMNSAQVVPVPYQYQQPQYQRAA